MRLDFMSFGAVKMKCKCGKTIESPNSSMCDHCNQMVMIRKMQEDLMKYVSFQEPQVKTARKISHRKSDGTYEEIEVYE